MILRSHGIAGYPAYYSWLVSERLAPATRVAALFVVGLNTFFFALDSWIYPDRLLEFALVRILWSASMIAVYAATSRVDPLACARAGCLTAGLFLIGLSALGGGVTSPYWPALLILFLGMPVLMPITAVHALGIVSILTTCFAGLPIATGQIVDLSSYTVSVFFVVGAGIECVVSAAVLDGMRLSDFNSRIEIEAARDHLREMDSAKSRFTANVHHELRTPLTLILSPLAALLSGDYGDVPTGIRSVVRTMEINGRRLHRLINNLLDLAKLEGHQFSVVRRPLVLENLIKDVVTGVGPYAERKGVSVVMSGFGDMPALNADRDALDKVLVNLVGNSLKFTDKGGQIEIWGGRASAGTRIEVRDSGIGIPKDQLAKIFDRFAQVDGSTTRKFEGTGIGLSLAYELIELHDGRIWAESGGLGHGATMCFELPVGLRDDAGEIGEADTADQREAAAEPGAMESEAAEVGRSVERYSGESTAPNEVAEFEDGMPRVVIAEDNPDMRELLRFVLSKDYQVRVAENGREALGLVRRLCPDIVLTDVMMPEMSGTELCDALKSDPSTSHIPIVLVTSKAEHEMKVRGLELGADDYVTKPFHPRELLARVQALVRVHLLKEELKARNESLEAALGELRDTQEILIQTERRAAVGELAAGVAHEVNNPVNFSLNAARALRVEVSAVCDALGVAEKDAGQDGEQRVSLADFDLGDSVSTIDELATIIAEGLDRTSRLVGDLRDFAAPDDGEVADIDLDECIQATMSLVAPTYLANNVVFEFTAGETLPQVRGGASKINQVFLNLLKNGAQAIGEDGGRVLISAYRDQDEVAVVICDDGSGIPDSDIDHVFDPFYSTKACGVGAGLGLPTSRRICEEYGGSLTLVSTSHRGTSFEMRLKAVDSE